VPLSPYPKPLSYPEVGAPGTASCGGKQAEQLRNWSSAVTYLGCREPWDRSQLDKKNDTE